jgi:putative ABC transport system permease protein
MLVAQLAVRDCLYDRRLFFCFAMAFAAVLAPLLVIYGLKYGVIDHLLSTLRDDPRNREVIGVGNRNFEDAWFAQMRARADVAFVVPRTRSLAATAFVDRIDAEPGRSVTVELIPTAPGDPLLGPPSALVGPRALVLSQAAASKLNVNAGDPLILWVVRNSAGGRERVDLRVEVAAIAPSTIFQRDGAFIALDLLLAVEDWREGFAVAQYDWHGGARPDDRRYASYRLFARRIEDVAGLETDLNRQGLDVRTRAAEIESILNLDRNLSLVFLVVAATALVGYVLNLGSALWANVERKQRELSVIRLIGLPASAVARFPLVQSLLIASAGLAGALLMFAIAATVLNRLYAETYIGGAGAVCRLAPEHVSIAVGATLAIAAASALVAARRVLRIDPSEGLRDV